MDLAMYLEDVATLLVILAIAGAGSWLILSKLKALLGGTKKADMIFDVFLLSGQAIMLLSCLGLILLVMVRLTLNMEQPAVAAMTVSIYLAGAAISAVAAYKTVHRLWNG